MLPGPHFLRLSRARDAVVVARPRIDDWSGGAGVLRRTPNGLRHVRGSGIRRFGREQIVAPLPTGWEVGDHVGSAVYAGFLYDHYGHFLLESLARLWAPHPDPAVPVVWIAGWSESLSPWMMDVLDLVGAPADRRVVTAASGALAVDELVIPDVGFEFGRFMHPWLSARLACRAVERAGTGTHVWLSRSARVPHSGLDEELDLEEALRASGWTVVRPEDHTIGEQVELLGGAVHVAGIEGSAFHTLCLVRGFAGAVDLFTRQEHENFELVAAAAGLDQVRHRIPGATPRERTKVRGTDVQWSGVDIDATLAVLGATCDRHGHAPPCGTSTRREPSDPGAYGHEPAGPASR